MVAKRVNAGNNKPRRPPAKTPEAREQQLSALAYDLAEQQLIQGTASAQVISYFLKLESQKEKLERVKLRNENILLEARAEQIASGARIEELYSDAIAAMKEYGGQQSVEETDE